MSALSAALERAVSDAREMKEARVRATHSARRGATDIPPLIQGWRGTERVVLLTPFQADRDGALHAAHLAATWFGCDVVACSTDGCQSVAERNPITGKPWGRGEMQRAVDDDGALEAGWVTEGLTTWVVNRAGDVRGALLPYRVGRRVSSLGITTHDLVWQQPTMPTDAEWSGLVADCLIDSMNQRTLDTVLATAGLMPSAEEFGLSGEEAQAWKDCALVRALYHLGVEHSVMLVADSVVRASVIEDSLGRLNTLRPPS